MAFDVQYDADHAHGDPSAWRSSKVSPSHDGRIWGRRDAGAAPPAACFFPFVASLRTECRSHCEGKPALWTPRCRYEFIDEFIYEYMNLYTVDLYVNVYV